MKNIKHPLRAAAAFLIAFAAAWFALYGFLTFLMGFYEKHYMP
jgi:hypothetical protein